MGAFITTVFCMLVLFSLLKNRDLFSPAKFFLLNIVLFFGGAISSDLSSEVWIYISAIVVSGLIMLGMEKPPRGPEQTKTERCNGEKAPSALLLWACSLPGIIAQTYLIYLFGGLEGYVNIIGSRLAELRGLGALTTLTRTLQPINCLFFAFGLAANAKKRWWMVYVIHSLLVLSSGLLSGSRGMMLNAFVIQIVLFSYLRRRISVVYVGVLAILLLYASSVIGIARNNLKFEDGSLITGLAQEGKVTGRESFSLGVEPLRIISEVGVHNLANGRTFLSAITNVVPRKWWPDKPDTGGVFFTKQYTGDAWSGLSNLTPTLIGECVINFGPLLGVTVYLLLITGISYYICYRYRVVVSQVRSGSRTQAPYRLVMYVYIMWGGCSLLSGEFTNVIISTIIGQIVPTAIVYRLIVILRPETDVRLRALA
jgi:hypothetical protein